MKYKNILKGIKERLKLLKILSIMKEISILTIVLSIIYIGMNLQPLYVNITTLFTMNNNMSGGFSGNQRLADDENKTFILYDNSAIAKKSKENDIYEGMDTIQKMSFGLESLILVNKDNNKEIEKKLEEERTKMLKVENSDSKKKSDTSNDFFSLSFDMNKDEQKLYGDKSFIIIPKINVEAPIRFPSIEEKDLEKHILKLLENGVVHRPETQLPFQQGNFFILGHSSNYAWIMSKYNNIFSKIDLLDLGDEADIFYKGRKYVYLLKEKKIVNPTEIGVYGYIPGYNLSIMTCWPIGSAKQRLIGIFELNKNL